MHKKTIRDVPDELWDGATVLARVDYNVPLEDGRVTDDTRIRATLPTLEYLTERGARPVLVAHLGRPKGEWRDELSLRPAAERLSALIDAPVEFVPAVVGEEARAAADELSDGEILVLENVRFLAGEKRNDRQLGEALAGLGTAYVNDAFGAAHRAHASTSAAAEAMRAKGGPAVAGLLMEQELRFLGDALEAPEQPFVAILGGAKISGKIDVIDSLLTRVDRLLIGGAMANTFFRALGLETGRSLVEEERVDTARALVERAGDTLLLPVDCIVAEEAEAGAETHVVERTDTGPGLCILDIGPTSVAAFQQVIGRAGTVVWNGPLGLFEVDEFSRGTAAIARAVADATDAGTLSVIGGGDTAAAVRETGLAERMSHISTGGGASLEVLEGGTLPGLAVLDDKRNETKEST